MLIQITPSVMMKIIGISVPISADTVLSNAEALIPKKLRIVAPQKNRTITVSIYVLLLTKLGLMQ